MGNQKINQNIIRLTLSIAVLTLMGCGSAKAPTSNQSELGSRTTVPDSTGGTPTSNGNNISECNSIGNSSLGTSGGITLYKDSYTKQYFNDLVRLTIKSLPDSLKTSDNHYLHIFKWYEDSPGHRSYSSEKVLFKFQLRGTYISNPYSNQNFLITSQAGNSNQYSTNVISKVKIQEIINLNNLSGYTVDNFFDHVLVILTGLDLNFEALSFSFYDTNQGNEAYSFYDVLLPAFYSNPNIYAEGRDANSLLLKAHPNYQYKDSGWSEADYLNNTLQYCL